jgi:DNA-binding CsgD family transcriptional regulator
MNQGLKRPLSVPEEALGKLELIALTLAAHGYEPAAIATRLDLARDEVEALLINAERKLGAENRMHAITIAARTGLIGIEV